METFLEDMLAGLSQQQKAVSPKYFYDAVGSDLFDQICTLPEYYLTRTELSILTDNAIEIAEMMGSNVELIEFGAGSLVKIRLLLQAFSSPHALKRFVPIDISGEHLEASAKQLKMDFPSLEVRPIVGDYMSLSSMLETDDTALRAGFFPGSTIGNMDVEQALDFLRNAAEFMPGGGLLIGVDLVKDPQRLHAAYNDSQGVTAAFNLNLLHRANAELDADFDVDAFSHYATYNPVLRRIEMHLISQKSQQVTLGGRCFSFAEGESIHTESSHKYTIESFQHLARQAGFQPTAVWVDKSKSFSVHWLVSNYQAAQHTHNIFHINQHHDNHYDKKHLDHLNGHDVGL